MVSEHEGWSVYFATSAGKTKVGVAGRSPEERVVDLQRGSAVPIVLVYAHDAGSRTSAVRAEARIHSQLRFEGRHSHGEWFDGEIAPDEASRLCDLEDRPPRPKAKTPRSNHGKKERVRRETPSWTPEQWRRHDERCCALREAALLYDDQEALAILREMEAALVVQTIERVAERAEVWYAAKRIDAAYRVEEDRPKEEEI